MTKEQGDYHTSQSKLKLGDNIRKSGHLQLDPSIARHCDRNAKTCKKTQQGSFMTGVLGQVPGPIRKLGPKQYQILSQFRTSVITYSITAFLLTTYICEWKAVLQYLPYYNGKYKKD